MSEATCCLMCCCSAKCNMAHAMLLSDVLLHAESLTRRGVGLSGCGGTILMHGCT